MALGFTSRVRHPSYLICPQITESSQGGKDISLTANYTGIGALGKEKDTGTTTTGEDLNKKDTMD